MNLFDGNPKGYYNVGTEKLYMATENLYLKCK